MLSGSIQIKGAREHNLRNLDVAIPHGKLTVVTGVSGSGKSSLAFDTLYAEGYRKYIDSLSTRARQVLEQLPRPEVDAVEGLSPVVAIEQRTGGGANPRSTVATVTEIADYARLLWALAGTPHCPKDGGRIVRRTLDDCVARVLAEPEGSRAMLLAPYLQAKPSVLRGELPHLQQKGFQRVRLGGPGGEIHELETDDWLPSGAQAHQLDLVIDRIIVRADQRSRSADSLALAFREGQGVAFAAVQENRDAPWREIALSQEPACEICGTTYPEVTSKTFSASHPAGACPTCGGLGETLQFAPELVVPDPSLSVRKGAIKPWRLGSKRMIIQRNAILKQLAAQLPFDPTTPWQDLEESTRQIILHGAGERRFAFKLKAGNSKPVEQTFDGVLADLEQTRRETSSDGLRTRFLAYQTRSVCPDCGGQRLSAFSRAVTLAGKSYPDFMAMDLGAALGCVAELAVQPAAGEDRLTKLRDVREGLAHRLRFLNEVGLHYLTLGRAYETLSGGEAQRVRLATQLGMGLVGVTYVLDEPTIGLHPSDTTRLVKTMQDLRERGNTVVVVEHDATVMRAAEHLVEIGPGAGPRGGGLVFTGTLADAEATKKSRTGAYLSGRARIEKGGVDGHPTGDWLTVHGAREHNLRDVTAAFPVGLLTCVTGVSGSGKSTLVNEILAKAAAWKLNKARDLPGRHDRVDGLHHFTGAVRVDQTPIGRSPRSNAATFTKLFDELRSLYAKTPLAKVRGYGPGRFSFNTRGGRCENCQGAGVIQLDMQFLTDVYTVCPSCQGQRYNRETLEVRYRGLSIAEALDLSVDDAWEHFQKVPKIAAKLATLRAVGLGYLKLGQPATTLSGGEAQRIKLSLELSKRQSGQTLYLLDEPTTGLHWDDIQLLVDLLFKLRDQGHTIILIEHDLDVIRLADWVIDLGPGGGDAGGELVYAGPVRGLMGEARSATGRALGNARQ